MSDNRIALVLLLFSCLLSALFIQCKVAAPRALHPEPENIGFAEYLDIKSQIDFNNACSEPNLVKMSRPFLIKTAKQ